MSYSFAGRVRYSEIGEDVCLTLPGILDYFQDCCTFQSEEIGQGVEALERRQRAWVLSSWQVIVNRYPRLGEEIITTTYPYEFRGFLGMRNFILKTKEGEILAYANSFWTNISTVTGLPERLTEEDKKGYVLDKKLEMDYAPRKIAVPSQGVREEPFTVVKSHLDTHHHVNNCQYVRLAAGYLPQGFAVKELRTEYKKQAVLGDVFYPFVSAEDGKVTVVLGTENGDPYATVVFIEAA